MVPIEIDVWQGDVSELEVDAIIVPANESLFMTAPVARAVRRRAGEAVEREAVQQGPVEAGTAVVTSGGALAAPYVIHAVGVGHDLRADPARLQRALDASLSIAERLGLHRLAMSPIGVEHGVFSPEEAAAHLVAVLVSRSETGAALPSSLVLAIGSPIEAAAMRAAIQPIGSGG
jgi:O-acetyl-ADP-ribose deacetylase (regulator of RNase III)